MTRNVIIAIAIMVSTLLFAVYFYKTNHRTEISSNAASNAISEKQQVSLSKGPIIGSSLASVDSKEYFIKDIEETDDYKIFIEFNGNEAYYYSIFRKPTPSGNFELALAQNISGFKWKSYPPIDYEQAKNILKKLKQPLTREFTQQTDLMHFRGSRPFYMFSYGINKNILGIDAETGDIVSFDANTPTKRDMDKIEIEESKTFLRKFNFIKNGFLEINRDAWNTLSDQEKQDMENATKETNKLIREGKLKLDSDFNIIYDYRSTQ